MAKLRLLTVVGARPQIIKAAAIGRAIAGRFRDRMDETILHTGQHYDADMSQVFFDELGIAPPHVQLGTGSGTHGAQTARMIEGIEQAIVQHRPDVVLLYGDTNSTLAGAVAAAKLHVPVAHVEAGLRSFNKAMPEEINRIVCDHCSTWLFCPTRTGVDNLLREGFTERTEGRATADRPHVVHAGDVMYDNSLHFLRMANERSRVLADNGLEPDGYLLATVHRAHNTDRPERLAGIVAGLLAIHEEHRMPLVLPLHPRTRKQLDALPDDALRRRLLEGPDVHVMPPAGFLDMTALEGGARLVATDSGGVQKEAWFLGKPCVILREETEWTELVDSGDALLAGADPERMVPAARTLMARGGTPRPHLFGDGHAAELICGHLIRTA
ncbi:MAG: UDP-N-acetylglucosamine 2-epimerase (non-hydrolyzing) [Flavobacteriales bacterium]|jgi:UDP-GlcNAc3NAcA epimerase|nr:UDP-N-acetylglucosamine 2-epimerase (non-hydrolyzing) [Flavobacteriales bacterium]